MGTQCRERASRPSQVLPSARGRLCGCGAGAGGGPTGDLREARCRRQGGRRAVAVCVRCPWPDKRRKDVTSEAEDITYRSPLVEGDGGPIGAGSRKKSKEGLGAGSLAALSRLLRGERLPGGAWGQQVVSVWRRPSGSVTEVLPPGRQEAAPDGPDEPKGCRPISQDLPRVSMFLVWKLVLRQEMVKSSPPGCPPGEGAGGRGLAAGGTQAVSIRRAWRRASPRSRPRAATCRMRWCGTSPSTSPSKAPTPLAGRRLCSACTDRTCSGTTWSAATGRCTCPSRPADTRGPSPCSSRSPHRSCRSSQAGSWDGGLSTRTPRWWPRVKAGK